MNKEKRKASADFDYKLTQLLTDCKTDEEMFERLCWALQRISTEISQFTTNS